MALIVFEDEHVLAVNKPAGWNTHSPAPYAGEGLYEWLRNREARWGGLSIIHRLDKETSGLVIFGKTAEANRSLSRQFENRSVRKSYWLLTNRKTAFQELRVQSALVRSGDKYVARPPHVGAVTAETLFRPLGERIEATPITGKTHQIRVHAAAHGFPILGDVLYGGAPAPRLCLHAAQLILKHPVSGRCLELAAPVNFDEDSTFALREAVIDPAMTDAFRVVHGSADGWLCFYIDRLGEYLLAQSGAILTEPEKKRVEECALRFGSRAVYHKILQHGDRSAPTRLWGAAAPGEISIRENGLSFEISLDEPGSNGLFLDQRDNRRRLLAHRVGPNFDLAAGGEVLNAFAYTCGFSVCAAFAGARVTSLDLSKNYLEWGRRNFQRNGIDPARHEFIYGDAFDWFRRLAKKNRLFDMVILDPPTFSRSKATGIFQAERDYGKLVAAAVPLVKQGGVLFASTNAARFGPEDFLSTITASIARAGRRITLQHYAPQPPDFPVDRTEPAYLKTVWLRLT